MSLQLVDQGTLVRPGPIGRVLRLSFGLLCVQALWELANIAPDFIASPIQFLPNIAIMLLIELCIFNYVVNIGFSRDWGRYPVIVSLLLFALLAVGSFIINADLNSYALGLSMFAWLVYFFAHLGLSFLLAALLATPGCEMRAIPELLGKIKGKASREHHCPVSFISKIDNWEDKRRNTGN